jgi:hypothetical protein
LVAALDSADRIEILGLIGPDAGVSGMTSSMRPVVRERGRIRRS